MRCHAAHPLDSVIKCVRVAGHDGAHQYQGRAWSDGEQGLRLRANEAEVRRLRLQPGDTVVARVGAGHVVPQQVLANMQDELKKYFPDHAVLVTDGAVEVYVLGAEDGARLALRPDVAGGT